MAKESFPITFGGLNNKDASFDILDNQAQDLLNVVFTRTGGAETRGGSTLFGDDTGANDISGMGVYEYDNGLGTKTKSLFRSVGTAVEKYISGTWTTQAGVTLTDGYPCQFVQANNRLYIFNGIDAVWRLDNTTWTQLSSGAPFSGANTIGRYAVFHKGALYVTGMFGDQDLVKVSGDSEGSLNDQENFSGGWDYSISKRDNTGAITGLIKFNDYVYVAKQNGFTSMIGTATSMTLQDKLFNVGCIAPRSLATDGSYIYFLAGDGHVHAYDGGVNEYKLSEIIRSTMEGLNATRYSTACGIYHKRQNQYLLSVADGSDTTNTLTLMLDLNESVVATNDDNLRWFSKFSGIVPSVWIEFSDSSSSPNLLFGEGGEDSKVYTMYSGTSDNGTAIDSYYITKSFSANDPERDKRWKELFVDAYQSGDWDLNCYYATNGQTAFVATTPATINLASPSTLPFTLPHVIDAGFIATYNTVLIYTDSRYIAFKFRTTGLNEYFRLFRAILYFNLSKMRRRISITS